MNERDNKTKREERTREKERWVEEQRMLQSEREKERNEWTKIKDNWTKVCLCMYVCVYEEIERGLNEQTIQ